MKKLLVFLFFTTVIQSFISCNNNKQPKQLNSDTTSFFPVNDYLATDINDVLKTPYFIYKKVTTNKQLTDSVVITAQEFKLLANIFLDKSIASLNLKPLYQPSLFNDLSTKSISFTYTALEESLPVRNVIVLLDDETNKLKNVFISAITSNKDSTITEKLNWKAGKSFSINRFIEKANGTKTEQIIFVNWNDKL